MNQIVSDFLKVGTLRLFSRALFGLRGLVIIVSLRPYDFGEYTIWLLFIFYFSMLDFGVLNSLERDISHYKGEGNFTQTEQIAAKGWSSFIILTVTASFSLAIISFFVYGRWPLSLLLALYLLADKLYRAHDTNARINFQFKESGIAELILAVSSLSIIWFLLPRFGIYCIFVGFILASFLGSYFLYKKSPLQFRWEFQFGKSIRYIKTAIPLAVMIYSIEIFHIVPLTILAFLWDKETLGYYAVAFRIFQICLSIFPCLIQDVMRTRMYYHVAQKKDKKDGLKELLPPMGMYGLITAIFWLCVYWWTDWGVGRFIPEYINSVTALKVLTLTLLPLGIVKICSDYLCSPVIKKTLYVIMSWLFCVLLQGFLLYFIKIDAENILNIAPVIYSVCTMVVYILVVGQSFRIQGQWKESALRMLYLLIPLGCVYALTYSFSVFFHIVPTKDFLSNLSPFLASASLAFCFFAVLIWIGRFNKTFKLFLPGVK